MKINTFSAECYLCKKEIFGLKNKYGGTFYKTSIDGNYHYLDCKGFKDNEQNGNLSIYIKKSSNDPLQIGLFNQNKISRICWNTNGWVRPSGRRGKTETESYEFAYGFGHEEWLFDLDKIIDGYHYAFLQPINFSRNTLLNKKINILLYSRNFDTRKAYWVGLLNNVEVIDKKLSEEVFYLYDNNGWLREMKESLKEIGVWGEITDNEFKREELFNIRYKITEIENIFEYPIEVEDENYLTTYRYRLIENNVLEESLKENNDFDFKAGVTNSVDLKGSTTIERLQKTYEMELRHNKIMAGFLEYLQNKYGQEFSKRECPVNGNSRIDIARNDTDGYIFYEIKTYNNLKTSLRTAIGQLLEYACYPDKNRANKLYLVSDLNADNEFKKYINHIRKIINIPLGYIQFDLDSKKIIDEI